VVCPWVAYGSSKYKEPISNNQYPSFNDQENWSEIRERIIRRDKQCTRCGDVLKLEVDHIVEVQHGGLPVDENLRTLCAVCHKGKKIWST
jgi:5-methylcytosine-specific restriction endonuclease McrA